MPLSDLIWTCNNDFDTETTYKKGTTSLGHPNQGVCAGQSALWCKNIATGVRDIMSKPDLMRAMILQRLYDWSSDRGQLCEQVGLTLGTSKHHNNYRRAAKFIAQNAGIYYLSMYGHGVAAANRNGLLFFDPNFGCYRCKDEARLLEVMRDGRKAVGIDASEGMLVISVS